MQKLKPIKKQFNKAYGFILILFLINYFVVSCSFESLYESTMDIPKGKWDKNTPVKFVIPVSDTLNSFNFVLGIRNNNNYPYENLYLFVDTKTPTNSVKRDTIEIDLCDKQGKWYGKGIGGVWQNKIYYKKNYRFQHSGNYEISIIQAMRNNELEGIIDLGIKIEPTVK